MRSFQSSFQSAVFSHFDPILGAPEITWFQWRARRARRAALAGRAGRAGHTGPPRRTRCTRFTGLTPSARPTSLTWRSLLTAGLCPAAPAAATCCFGAAGHGVKMMETSCLKRGLDRSRSDLFKNVFFLGLLPKMLDK